MKASRTLFRTFALSLSILALAVPSFASSDKLDDNKHLNDFLQSEPTTLDISRRADAYSSTIMVNTMEGVVRLREVEGQYELSPAGAERWDHNEDGTVWTFHLRPNKWEDGEAVTAEQYVYSLLRSADPKTGSPSNFFLEPLANFDEVSKGKKTVEELGVKALDDMTLQITLKAPTPMFMSMINATLYYSLRKDKIDQLTSGAKILAPMQRPIFPTVPSKLPAGHITMPLCWKKMINIWMLTRFTFRN